MLPGTSRHCGTSEIWSLNLPDFTEPSGFLLLASNPAVPYLCHFEPLGTSQILINNAYFLSGGTEKAWFPLSLWLMAGFLGARGRIRYVWAVLHWRWDLQRRSQKGGFFSDQWWVKTHSAGGGPLKTPFFLCLTFVFMKSGEMRALLLL